MTTMDDDAVLGDLGLSEAPDDPNEVPDGQFKAVIHEIKMFTHNQKEEGKNRFVILTYRIVDPEYPNLRDSTVDEWKSANKGDTPKQKGFLKSRFLGLGVSKPDVDAGRINFKKLCGTPVIITVRNKDGFTNINKVVLADDKGWVTPPANNSVNTSAQQPATSSAGNSGKLDF